MKSLWWFFLGVWATTGFFFWFQAKQDFSKLEDFVSIAWLVGGVPVFGLLWLLVSKLTKGNTK